MVTKEAARSVPARPRVSAPRGRRLAAWAAALVIGAAAAMAGGTPAQASSLSVHALYHHSTGRLAVEGWGDLRWLNRSVTVTDPTMYCIESHSCLIEFRGLCGNKIVDSWESANVTAGKPESSYFTNFTLDGSSCVGGIDTVTLIVTDGTHGGNAVDLGIR